MKILVTGGAGHLGRVVVEHLKTDGHRVRILARHPLDDSTVEWVRADLGHSSNLASAVEGVDAVIHAATHFPAAQRSSFRPLDFIRSPTDVDIDGTCALLAAAEEAGVEHSVHVSIVGLEHMARINPYSRVKLAPSGSCASRRCRGRSSARPGFYRLLERMLAKMARKPCSCCAPASACSRSTRMSSP
jgi:UDP-glucose 4-epimerase